MELLLWEFAAARLIVDKYLTQSVGCQTAVPPAPDRFWKSHILAIIAEGTPKSSVWFIHGLPARCSSKLGGEGRHEPRHRAGGECSSSLLGHRGAPLRDPGHHSSHLHQAPLAASAPKVMLTVEASMLTKMMILCS